MTPYQAQRIRFGILAARHMLERFRMPWRQTVDLEAMELVGWVVGDAGTSKAFANEYDAAADRVRYRAGAITLDEMRRLQRERITSRHRRH